MNLGIIPINPKIHPQAYQVLLKITEVYWTSNTYGCWLRDINNKLKNIDYNWKELKLRDKVKGNTM